MACAFPENWTRHDRKTQKASNDASLKDEPSATPYRIPQQATPTTAKSIHLTDSGLLVLSYKTRYYSLRRVRKYLTVPVHLYGMTSTFRDLVFTAHHGEPHEVRTRAPNINRAQ